MKMIKILFVAITILFAVNVFALEQNGTTKKQSNQQLETKQHQSKTRHYASPVKMLRTVSTKAIDQLKSDKKGLKSSKQVPLKKIHVIINNVLLPHVDLNRMSREVLGRNVWDKATKAEKKRFKVQFTDLVINTYASALTTFDKNRIKFFPIRGGYKGRKIIQVNSEVDAPGAPPLPVVYHLERHGSHWLVYDLSVDGISLVQSYKAQFAAVIQQKKLNGLITTLETHNQTLASQ